MAYAGKILDTAMTRTIKAMTRTIKATAIMTDDEARRIVARAIANGSVRVGGNHSCNPPRAKKATNIIPLPSPVPTK